MIFNKDTLYNNNRSMHVSKPTRSRRRAAKQLRPRRQRLPSMSLSILQSTGNNVQHSDIADKKFSKSEKLSNSPDKISVNMKNIKFTVSILLICHNSPQWSIDVQLSLLNYSFVDGNSTCPSYARTLMLDLSSAAPVCALLLPETKLKVSVMNSNFKLLH